MNNIIIAIAGIGVMLWGLAFFLRNFMLRKNGIETEAEVIKVAEDTRKAKGGRAVNGYIHTLRYEAKGKTIEARDRTGYVQPLKKGSVQTIVYSRKNPEIFEYAAQLDRNIKLYLGLAAVGAVFAARFIILGMK